jgi:hypothetical protein
MFNCCLSLFVSVEVLPSQNPSNALAVVRLPAVALGSVICSQGMFLPGPIQGLNLNFRSIAGPKTEMPVTLHNKPIQLAARETYAAREIYRLAREYKTKPNDPFHIIVRQKKLSVRAAPFCVL